MTPTEVALAHAVAAIAALNGQYANIIAQAAELIELFRESGLQPSLGNRAVDWLQDPTVLHARDVGRNKG